MHTKLLALSLVWSALLVMIGAATYVARQIGYPVANLFRDPAAALEAPWYTGLFSLLGVNMWAAAGAICLFSFAVVRSQSGSREVQLFLLFFGLFSLLLCFDDLYQFHETVIPRWFRIPEVVVLATYALLLAGSLLRFRSTILQTDYRTLVAALVCFGVAVVLDQVPISSSVRTVAENGLELLGISAWLMYFGFTSFRMVADASRGSRFAGWGAAAKQPKVSMAMSEAERA